MAGMVLRKTGVVLLTILKWILQAALVALKLVLGIAKLFLLLLSLVMRIVLPPYPPFPAPVLLPFPLRSALFRCPRFVPDTQQ